MTPEVENLFNELVELTPDQRQQYFLRHAIDDSLRREVESLLACDRDASKRLQTSITQLAHAALPPPPRCGSYELKELIGQGGMGAVYRAIRVDGEIHQQAAVKLMHSGWSNPNLRDRFLRERQILAGLSHPHIASLLDAGRTEDNRPYFVMELVEGRPINQYCASLPLAARIHLFLKVCDAVSFAHSRLIVHRDLKPGNILVTAGGVPKLLDFGIAKIMDGDSETTHTSDRMVTPAFASPEQILGGVVTTTNDVYSLGAVLYKLLTGKAPHTDEQATPEEQFLSMINGVIKRPREHNRDLPGDLEIYRHESAAQGTRRTLSQRGRVRRRPARLPGFAAHSGTPGRTFVSLLQVSSPAQMDDRRGSRHCGRAGKRPLDRQPPARDRQPQVPPGSQPLRKALRD
jgi:serine/threonine protein kinase